MSVQETQNSSIPVIPESGSVNQHHLNVDEKEILIEAQGDHACKGSDVNVTEILISTKTNLELQIKDLNEKLTNLESLYISENYNHNISKQKLIALEHELKSLSNKYEIAVQDAASKDESLLELKNRISTLTDENNNLVEQVEFTKSMLTTKEIENTELVSKLSYCKNQLDVLQLQIQQLTNSSNTSREQSHNTSEEKEALIKKISRLEQTIESLQKERDQINTHYEHYVRELNDQYGAEVKKNEGLAQEIQNLHNRESMLIEQISEMEIRIQNYKVVKEDQSCKQEDADRQKQYQDTQVINYDAYQYERRPLPRSTTTV